jgi:hypothetical protein
MTDARLILACVNVHQEVTETSIRRISTVLGSANADAILAALNAAGLVVVPREPTAAMLDAYGRLRTATAMAFPALSDMEMSPSLWRAMVAAAHGE